MKKDHLLNAFKNKEISKIAMNKFVGGHNGHVTEEDYRTDNPDAPGGWESDCYTQDNDMVRDHRTASPSSNAAS